MEEEPSKPWDAGVQAMRQSLSVAKEGQPDEALRILDHAIAQASGEKRGMWVGTLCRHAAVLANAMGTFAEKYSMQNRPFHMPMITASPAITSPSYCCVLARLRVLNVMQGRHMNWQGRRGLKPIVT